MNRILLTLALCLKIGFSNGVFANNLLLLSSEGGDFSDRKMVTLKNFLNTQGCSVSEIQVAEHLKNASNFDWIFSPIELEFNNKLIKTNQAIVLNGEPLSSSILVRGSTGIESIEQLVGVHFAFLNENSKTGYLLAKALLDAKGLKLELDKQTRTISNTSSMVLLLHKDVFAAAVATPLARKWEKPNDLKIVATSKSVAAGGVWVNDSLSKSQITNCQNAFNKLTVDNGKTKRILKVFPEWISGFKSVLK